jgi:hypothetical protein
MELIVHLFETVHSFFDANWLVLVSVWVDNQLTDDGLISAKYDVVII